MTLKIFYFGLTYTPLLCIFSQPMPEPLNSPNSAWTNHLTFFQTKVEENISWIIFCIVILIIFGFVIGCGLRIIKKMRKRLLLISTINAEFRMRLAQVNSEDWNDATGAFLFSSPNDIEHNRRDQHFPQNTSEFKEIVVEYVRLQTPEPQNGNSNPTKSSPGMAHRHPLKLDPEKLVEIEADINMVENILHNLKWLRSIEPGEIISTDETQDNCANKSAPENQMVDRESEIVTLKLDNSNDEETPMNKSESLDEEKGQALESPNVGQEAQYPVSGSPECPELDDMVVATERKELLQENYEIQACNFHASEYTKETRDPLDVQVTDIDVVSISEQDSIIEPENLPYENMPNTNFENLNQLFSEDNIESMKLEYTKICPHYYQNQSPPQTKQDELNGFQELLFWEDDLNEEAVEDSSLGYGQFQDVSETAKNIIASRSHCKNRPKDGSMTHREIRDERLDRKDFFNVETPIGVEKFEAQKFLLQDEANEMERADLKSWPERDSPENYVLNPRSQSENDKFDIKNEQDLQNITSYNQACPRLTKRKDAFDTDSENDFETQHLLQGKTDTCELKYKDNNTEIHQNNLENMDASEISENRQLQGQGITDNAHIDKSVSVMIWKNEAELKTRDLQLCENLDKFENSDEDPVLLKIHQSEMNVQNINEANDNLESAQTIHAQLSTAENISNSRTTEHRKDSSSCTITTKFEENTLSVNTVELQENNIRSTNTGIDKTDQLNEFYKSEVNNTITTVMDEHNTHKENVIERKEYVNHTNTIYNNTHTTIENSNIINTTSIVHDSNTERIKDTTEVFDKTTNSEQKTIELFEQTYQGAPDGSVPTIFSDNQTPQQINGAETQCVENSYDQTALPLGKIPTKRTVNQRTEIEKIRKPNMTFGLFQCTKIININLKESN